MRQQHLIGAHLGKRIQHVIIKIRCPHGWSIQSIARMILKLNELLKMVEEPFSSILNQIRQNLAQNSHKFVIGIIEKRDSEILTINCSKILRKKVVRIVDTRT